jgi:hypothetical protein
MSSLKYVLPSITLSYKQITKIKRCAVDNFISAMGIDHSRHRALMYDPADYGGFHLYMEMMGMKLEIVISHLSAETEPKTSMLINFNYIQLHVGTGNPIFQSHDGISYVQMKWIIHLRQFLNETNATSEIKDLWLPRLQFKHDQFLMTAFMN